MKQMEKNSNLISESSEVVCQECGKAMKWIQNSHLKSHNMTVEQYREKYPNHPMRTLQVQNNINSTRKKLDRPSCAREGCNKPVTEMKNKYCSNECRGKVHAETGHFSRFTTGELNPNRTDGSYAFGKSQKQQAFIRDNMKCCRCQADLSHKDSKYGVHHLVPRRLFESLVEADDLSNLVTLCSKDHREVEAEFVEHLYSLYKNHRYLSNQELMDFLRGTI